MARPPMRRKPDTGREAKSKHLTGLSGVVGSSARGKISPGTWETLLGGATQRGAGIHNRSAAQRESERLIVARKRSNIRGAKGPYRTDAESEERRAAWRKRTLRKTGRVVTDCQRNSLY